MGTGGAARALSVEESRAQVEARHLRGGEWAREA